MFHKCWVFGILPSEIFHYKAIAAPYKAWTLRCPLRGAQTFNTSINSTKLPFEKILRHPPHISRHHRTLTDAVRHQQTPANAIQCQPQPPHILEQPFWEPGTACWRHLVSVGVHCCPELSRDTWRRCLWANIYAYVYAQEKNVYRVSMWLRVYRGVQSRPCMVQPLLYNRNVPKGKTPQAWHFWNIKIPKPPYISSLKIIGLLHFLKFLGPLETNYLWQSFRITL